MAAVVLLSEVRLALAWRTISSPLKTVHPRIPHSSGGVLFYAIELADRAEPVITAISRDWVVINKLHEWSNHPDSMAT